jgi:hypothetical protein
LLPKREIYKDNKIHGLELRITASGRKTFSMYKKFKGSPLWVTFGTFPDIPPERIRLERDSSGARSRDLNRLLYKPS